MKIMNLFDTNDFVEVGNEKYSSPDGFMKNG